MHCVRINSYVLVLVGASNKKKALVGALSEYYVTQFYIDVRIVSPSWLLTRLISWDCLQQWARFYLLYSTVFS